VIGDNSGYEITDKSLQEANKFWFTKKWIFLKKKNEE
jgi:hypothetical protein